MAFLALGDVITAVLFQNGAFTAARFALRVGHPGRLGRGAAGADPRPALLLHVLRAARYAHAAALRRRPRLAHHRAGLRLRPAAAAAGSASIRAGAWPGSPPRPASAVGGIHAAAPHAEPAHRPTGLPVSLVAKLWGSAALAAAGAWGVKLAIGMARPVADGATHPLHLRGPLPPPHLPARRGRMRPRGPAPSVGAGHAR